MKGATVHKLACCPGTDQLLHQTSVELVAALKRESSAKRTDQNYAGNVAESPYSQNTVNLCQTGAQLTSFSISSSHSDCANMVRQVSTSLRQAALKDNGHFRHARRSLRPSSLPVPTAISKLVIS